MAGDGLCGVLLQAAQVAADLRVQLIGQHVVGQRRLGYAHDLSVVPPGGATIRRPTSAVAPGSVVPDPVGRPVVGPAVVARLLGPVVPAIGAAVGGAVGGAPVVAAVRRTVAAAVRALVAGALGPVVAPVGALIAGALWPVAAPAVALVAAEAAALAAVPSGGGAVIAPIPAAAVGPVAGAVVGALVTAGAGGGAVVTVVVTPGGRGGAVVPAPTRGSRAVSATAGTVVAGAAVVPARRIAISGGTPTGVPGAWTRCSVAIVAPVAARFAVVRRVAIPAPPVASGPTAVVLAPPVVVPVGRAVVTVVAVAGRSGVPTVATTVVGPGPVMSPVAATTDVPAIGGSGAVAARGPIGSPVPVRPIVPVAFRPASCGAAVVAAGAVVAVVSGRSRSAPGSSIVGSPVASGAVSGR
jgi:hypothetical protein